MIPDVKGFEGPGREHLETLKSLCRPVVALQDDTKVYLVKVPSKVVPVSLGVGAQTYVLRRSCNLPQRLVQVLSIHTYTYLLQAHKYPVCNLRHSNLKMPLSRLH